MPRHLNQNSKTEGSGRVQRQFKFKTTSTSSSRQLQPQVPRTCNKQTCYDPQLQGYFIWHCHLSHDPLAATSLDHRCTLVQVTYNTFKSNATSCKNIPKNRAVKNCRQVELQNHDNCENCCIHRPMSPHVSNCMQVTSNYLPMKTVDTKSKNSEMNITRHKIQNCCNCQIPTKPMHSFCKIVGRLLQPELDTLTTVSYTASASSSELTAPVVPRTAYALKNVDIKQQNVSKCKTTDAVKFK